MKREHEQISQTLIYIHQDIFTLQERLKAIDQAVQIISARIQNIQKIVEAKNDNND